ncbi:MAG: cation:proton antiporter [Dehalococcoidia bacterium]
MAQATLVFNQQIERLSTVLLRVVVGALLTRNFLPVAALWFVPLVLLVIRPLAAWVALLCTSLSRPQRTIIGWFGIRGIGSIYYFSYAIAHGLPEPYASRLTGLTLTVVAVSVIVHGVTVTPIMDRYQRMIAAEPGR